MPLASRAPSAYTSLLRSQSRSRINPERIFPYRTTKDTNSFNSTRRSNRSIDLYSTKLRRKDKTKFDITSKANLNYTFLDYTKKVARNRIIVVKFSQRMYESSHRLIIDCHSKIKIHPDLLVHGSTASRRPELWKKAEKENWKAVFTQEKQT